jgi:hypothetical protein
VQDCLAPQQNTDETAGRAGHKPICCSCIHITLKSRHLQKAGPKLSALPSLSPSPTHPSFLTLPMSSSSYTRARFTPVAPSAQGVGGTAPAAATTPGPGTGTASGTERLASSRDASVDRSRAAARASALWVINKWGEGGEEAHKCTDQQRHHSCTSALVTLQRALQLHHNHPQASMGAT